MKKELKQIKFRAILKGKGIVNYDGDQKELLMNCRKNTAEKILKKYSLKLQGTKEYNKFVFYEYTIL